MNILNSILILKILVLALVGCSHQENTDLPSADILAKKTEMVNKKIKNEIETKKRNVCPSHISNQADRIKRASKDGENSVFLSNFYCQEGTGRGGCLGYRCDEQLNTFVKGLESKGYKVVSADEAPTSERSRRYSNDVYYVTW